ncbi:MAG: TlyA family RNA methyltransferase [Coriobacteriales bacterium]|nr:TlyA family RNA methyltransferase [Coriobacteriales bacterium]
MRLRADALLADRGLFPSREQARAAILAGEVRVGDEPIRKAGQMVDEDAVFEIAERPRYVSRGGDKLAGALSDFGIDVGGVKAIDVGASTGGFTDCLLQGGAASVVALDVGYGQLAWSLRTDERVTVVERTNIRVVDPTVLGGPFDLAVVDVSFISLRTVLPHVVSLLAERGQIVALVKPQFEAGKGRVGKRGVVRDPVVHSDVLRGAVDAAHEQGLVVKGLTFSPITGPEGNIEFWMWAARVGDESIGDIDELVGRAHRLLGG